MEKQAAWLQGLIKYAAIFNQISDGRWYKSRSAHQQIEATLKIAAPCCRWKIYCLPCRLTWNVSSVCELFLKSSVLRVLFIILWMYQLLLVPVLLFISVFSFVGYSASILFYSRWPRGEIQPVTPCQWTWCWSMSTLTANEPRSDLSHADNWASTGNGVQRCTGEVLSTLTDPNLIISGMREM